MIFRVLFFLMFVSSCMVVTHAAWSARHVILDADASYEPVFMPILGQTSVIIDADDVVPREPNISQTRFLKYPPVTSLEERVDRLIYGIETDIRPEMDHYGYEIRRYMARVGNIEVFDDPEFLAKQINNVKKARIIADYWKKYTEKEVAEIEAIFDADDKIDLRVRTAFKQNRVTAQTFMISLKSWIDSNERLLMHIHQKPGLYEVDYPEVLIVVPTVRLDFYNYFVVRQSRLKDIQQYQPFALMVY